MKKITIVFPKPGKIDRLLSALLFSVLLSFAAGCAGLKEGSRGFVGVSTKVLEDNLNIAKAREFEMDFNSCYFKAQGILADIGSYVYVKDNAKKLIAVYVSEQDTTPVGLFFKSKTKSRTQILVSSPSNYARDVMAEKVFSAIEKSLKEKKVEVQLDSIEGKK